MSACSLVAACLPAAGPVCQPAGQPADCFALLPSLPLCRLRAGKPLPGGAPPALPEGPKDPPQLVEGVMRLFDRWARLLEEAPQEVQQQGFKASP